MFVWNVEKVKNIVYEITSKVIKSDEHYSVSELRDFCDLETDSELDCIQLEILVDMVNSRLLESEKKMQCIKLH